MILQITLGDIIGWIITMASVGIAVTVSINMKIANKKRTENLEQTSVINNGNMSQSVNVGGNDV